MRKNEINRAVSYNCNILGMRPPKVKMLPASSFLTKTTIAATSEDGSSIAINLECAVSDPDIWLAVSHELRHVWQIRRHFLSSAYVSRENAALDDYNIQFDEIDAHAWACIVCNAALGLRPKLEEQLPQNICRAIDKRAEEILAKKLYG